MSDSDTSNRLHMARSSGVSCLISSGGLALTKVVVIGSCMIDLACYAPRLPKAGETLIGTKFVMGYGGKGANQCVAAAKLGGTAALIARVGDDSFGLDYQTALAESRVNIKHVKMTKNSSTGMAQITVAENGENQIVIVPGANMQLTSSEVLDASRVLDGAEVLVFQLETPLNTNIEIMKRYINRVTIVLNAAPAPVKPDPEIFKLCDVFCVNESEAEIMTGVRVSTTAEAGDAIAEFLKKGCRTVIITMGALGSVFASASSPTPVHVPTQKVKPVDTTGAGDCFVGALAFYMAYHTELKMEEMIRRANAVASISVTKLGTQSSFPNREDVPIQLFV